MVVLHANRSKSGLKSSSKHLDIAIVGDLRPTIIGHNGVFDLCAFGRK